MGGTLRKRLENHQKNNLCLCRGKCAHEGEKKGFLTKTDGGYPTKKAGKSPKNATCAYEGEHVHMKRRLEDHQKRNLCVRRGKCAHEGEK